MYFKTMLPPGHIAAGYLTAYAIVKFSGYHFSPQQIDQILLFGGLIGFIPDLDIFSAFAKVGKFQFNIKKTDHRKYPTHAPLIWLIAGLAVFFLSSDPLHKTVGLVIWLSSWSHFLADTLQYGVMWLWPFSGRLYAVKDRELELIDFEARGMGFWRYWLKFVWFYVRKGRFTFFFETVLILSVLVLFFN